MTIVIVLCLIACISMIVMAGVTFKNDRVVGAALLALGIIFFLLFTIGVHTISYNEAQIDAANNRWRIKLEAKADGTKEWVRTSEVTTQPIRE